MKLIVAKFIAVYSRMFKKVSKAINQAFNDQGPLNHEFQEHLLHLKILILHFHCYLTLFQDQY